MGFDFYIIFFNVYEVLIANNFMIRNYQTGQTISQ